MKILQINCVYNTGSTGKIVASLHSYYLQHGHQSYVLYGRGGKSNDANIKKVSTELEAKFHGLLSRLYGLDFGYSPFATRKTIRLIRKIKPDVVHLHCLNGHFINVYKLVSFLKKANIKTILTLHAEIMHTAGCEHAVNCEKWINGCTKCKNVEGAVSRFFRDDAKRNYSLMKRAFENFKRITVVGVSDWLTKRAVKSSIFHDCRFATVCNGLDTDTFKFKNALQYDSNEQFKGVVLHVTPNFNHPLKGGVYVMELAKLMPDYKFIIIGYNGSNKMPSNVFAIGKIANQDELASYYSSSNVTLLTSLRETFSMIVAESLSCGTPVVGFEAGGPESISIKEYSKFVDYGDVSSLQSAVRYFCTMNIDKEHISTIAQEKYSKESMALGYLSIYKENY